MDNFEKKFINISWCLNRIQYETRIGLKTIMGTVITIKGIKLKKLKMEA